MNKKILVAGSIIAAIIIVLASFTSVVGFNTAKSTSAKASPLFGIRTRRATNDDSQDSITSDYIGKGREVTIPLPTINDKTVLLQKFMERIVKMDDTTFNRFADSFISHLHRDNKFKDADVLRVIAELHQLRANPDLIKNYNIEGEEYNLQNSPADTINYPTNGCWVPGCWITIIFSALLQLALFVYIVICVLSVCFHCGTIG